MRRYSIITFTTTLIAALLLLSACDVTVTPPKTHFTPDIKMPDIKIPDIDIKTLFATCDKKDSEMTFSKEALENTVAIEDTIDAKDIEYIDCDKKVTKTHGPVRNLNKSIWIEPPPQLKSSVNYILVSNQRTCAAGFVDTEKNDTSRELVYSSLEDSGRIKLKLSGSKDKLPYYTNVKEGNNIIKIQYYGKCLKYRENTDPKTRDSIKCEKAEELGSKEVLLKVRINLIAVPGVDRIDNCRK